jgi:hypothetical protein
MGMGYVMIMHAKPLHGGWWGGGGGGWVPQKKLFWKKLDLGGLRWYKVY